MYTCKHAMACITGVNVPIAICRLLLYRLNQKSAFIIPYKQTNIQTYKQTNRQTNKNVKKKQLIVLCRKLKKLLSELKIIKGQKDILYWGYKGTYTYIHRHAHIYTCICIYYLRQIYSLTYDIICINT